jgi:light-harvesting protein B-800-850 alpha chain
MNQGKIWLVVNPNHGLPLFLGAVAVTALLVHYAVLSHTTWFGGYWQGKAKATTSQVAPAPAPVLADATK